MVLVDLSGTVGAARRPRPAASRRWPLSQGLGDAPQYDNAAKLAVAWLAKHRAELAKKPKTAAPATIDSYQRAELPDRQGPRASSTVTLATTSDGAIADVDCAAAVTEPDHRHRGRSTPAGLVQAPVPIERPRLPPADRSARPSTSSAEELHRPHPARRVVAPRRAHDVLDAGGLELVVLAADDVGFHALRVPARAQRDRERLLGMVAPHALDDTRRALGIEADGVEAVAALRRPPVRGLAAPARPRSGCACAGFGCTFIASRCTNSPWKSTGSGPQHARSTSSISSMRRPRSANDCPSAANSASDQPTPGADREAAARQRVEAGERVRQRERVVLGHHQHARAEPDALGGGRGPGEREERVVEVGRRVVLRRRDGDVVAHPHVGEAQRLRRAAPPR